MSGFCIIQECRVEPGIFLDNFEEDGSVWFLRHEGCLHQASLPVLTYCNGWRHPLYLLNFCGGVRQVNHDPHRDDCGDSRTNRSFALQIVIGVPASITQSLRLY